MSNEENLKYSMLDLETLELNFKNKLIQYESVYNEYLSSMQDGNAGSFNSLSVVPGFYTAPPILSYNNATSATECLELCNANSSCTGANYTSDSGLCTLYSGEDGSLINDPSGVNYAIVTKKHQVLENLQQMNQELLDLNDVISNHVQDQYEPVYQHYEDNAEVNENMIGTFEQLLEERDELKRMMQDLVSLKEESKDQEIRISQGNSKYVFWGVIALITMFITVKLVFFPDSDVAVVRLFLNGCIVALLLVWLTNLRSVTGSFVVLFLIIMIIFSKMK